MSQSETQARLLGGPSGDSASISTNGRLIRPALEVPDCVVDEAKIHFTTDGVHVQAVDPANVSMCELDIKPSAFNDYDVNADDELLVGLNITRFTDNLSHARLGKRTNDPVEIDIDETRTIIEVSRDYDSATVHYADEQLNIDPDAIRQEPELPDLDLSGEADVGIDAFVDAIKHLNGGNDHATLQYRDGSLVITGDGNDDSPVDWSSAVEFEDAASVEDPDDERVRAKYSMSYLHPIAKALKATKADEMSLTWGTEYPLIIDFERSIDEETAYTGAFMLAPRIGDGA